MKRLREMVMELLLMQLTLTVSNTDILNILNSTEISLNDNLPVASSSSLTQSSTLTLATASLPEASSESKPAKAQQFTGKGNKIQDTSRLVGVKGADDSAQLANGANPKEAPNKGEGKKEPKQQTIKLKPIKSNKASNDDTSSNNEELQIIKEIMEERQKSQKPASKVSKQQSNIIQEDKGASKLIEDRETDGKQIAPGIEQSQIQNANAKGNNRQTEQMHEGQQGFMDNGKNEDVQPQRNGAKEAKSGKYITGKFINFLSDVANHLNVDKLSIAEELVKDVENTKQKQKNKEKVGETREANVVNDDGVGAMRRRLLEQNRYQHRQYARQLYDYGNPKIDDKRTRLDGISTRLEGTKSRLEGTSSNLDGSISKLVSTVQNVDGIVSKLDGASSKIDGENSTLGGGSLQVNGISSTIGGLGSRNGGTSSTTNVLKARNLLQIGRKKPEVIKYIWNKGISVVKEE
eukprot:gene17970-19766_t